MDYSGKMYAVSVRNEILRFCEKEDSDILNDILTGNSLYEWLNFKELDFCSRVDVLKLIAKACSCNDGGGVQFEFIQSLLVQKAALVTFLSRLLSEASNHPECDIASLCKLIFDVIHAIFQLGPLSSLDFADIILPQLQVILENSPSEIKSKLMTDIASLLEQKDKICQLGESPRQEVRETDMDIMPPPCDFRDIDLLPGENEMESQIRPYLRVNVVRGPYESANHYLDIQFRLLREDMFRYLRESVAEYKSRKWSREASAMLQNGHIYFNAKICEKKYSNRILFTATVRLERIVDWNSTKRLSPNSLLCLSCDRFETFNFACVHSRCVLPTDNLSCYLELYAADSDYFTDCIELGKLYDIIETSTFYESYKYVLERLKLFNLHKFPLSTCLLFFKDCNKTPKYLTTFSSPFSQQAKNENKYLSRALDNFDKDQKLAFEIALSNSVSVIQGPPGTGKTFLGLQIVKWLLQNASEKMDSPILVICYTNHALDQFLEGALMFTKKVVRIGGQSKNAYLEAHNVNNISNALLKEIKRKSIEDYCKATKKCTRCYEKWIKQVNRGKYVSETETRCAACSGEVHLSPDEDVIESESLKVGLYALNSPHLEQISVHTKQIRNTENGLRSLKESIHNLDTNTANTVYNDDKVLEMLPKYLWQQILGCSSSMKREILTKFVKGLENWLCVSLTYLHAYEDQPDFLALIIKEIMFFVKEKNLDVNVPAKKHPQINHQLVRSKTNVFLLELWDMYFKTQNLTDIEEVMPIDVNECIRQFLGEHFLDRKVIFRFLASAASKCLKKDKLDAKVEIAHIWETELLDRWQIFFRCISETRAKLLQDQRRLESQYLVDLEEREAARLQNSTKVAKEADILGLTTTGAAKHWKILEKIGPRVVIAEEAAEVLEAHLTTALTRNTEHLILIGDHKQLRPIPSVYELGRKYKLDISMFERLLINGAPSHCLQTQHRMRPCIAQLLVPEIYDHLENHPSVLQYEDIRGMTSNMYFIKHTVFEDNSSELRSHRNKHEANFLASLCHYLLQQGYDESSITVLTTYMGQLKFLNEAIKQKFKHNVRITTVDNFQGEENDIILLSFVRSNLKNALGFLEINNRICVALSRARKGLFCIGNFDSFADKCVAWKRILRKLEKARLISSELPLKCQNHPERITLVSCASDFSKVLYGGCAKQCTYNLVCGHNCPLQCHLDTEKHTQTTCSSKCRDWYLKRIASGIIVKESQPKNKETNDDSVIISNDQNTSLQKKSKFPESSADNRTETFFHTENVSNVHTELHDISVRLEGNKSNASKPPNDVQHSMSERFAGTEFPDKLFEFLPVDFMCDQQSIKYVKMDLPMPNISVGSDNRALSDVLNTSYDVSVESRELKSVSTSSGICSNTEVCNSLSREEGYNAPEEMDQIIHEDLSVSLFDKTPCVDYICSTGTCHHNTPENAVSSRLLCSTEGTGGNDALVMESVSEYRLAVMPLNTISVGASANTVKQEDNEKLEELEEKSLDELDLKCYEEYLERENNGKLHLSGTFKKKDSSPFHRSCGHNENGKEKCDILVLKKLPCTHEVYVPCSSCHLKYDCKVQTEIQLPCLHSLSVICSDWKWLKSIRCTVEQTLLMPCGQVIQFTCSETVSHAECSAVALKCGHKVPCYINVDEHRCDVPIKCTLPCSHEVHLPCILYHFTKKIASMHRYAISLQKMCGRKCDVLMECGHKCSDKCGACTARRMHAKCHEIVNKELPCGHHADYECHVKRLYCREICESLLECNHKCTAMCGKCSLNGEHAKCHEMVNRNLVCGHQVECECIVKEPYCPAQCVSVLHCGHTCPGECGQCFKFNIHAMCSVVVSKNLPCGHSVESACGSPFPVCEKRCLFGCWHRRCLNSCQYSCINCSKPCEWKCEHYTCSMNCGQLCDRPSCDLRCSKILTCGHQCVGYCGEPCPDLCLVCDNLVISTTDSSNWYVLLEDCCHSVQLKTLELYFEKKSPSSFPACPTCGAVIVKNKRFGNHIKSWLGCNLHVDPVRHHGQQSHLQDRIASVSRYSDVFNDFVSHMIQANISFAFVPSASKMYRNVCILRYMRYSIYDLRSWSLMDVASLEQWIVKHGPTCSDQQIEETGRAVRRVCAFCFLKNLVTARQSSKCDRFYSEVISLLESKTFGPSEEERMLEMLRHSDVDEEQTSNYANDLLRLIEYLSSIQESYSNSEIGFSEEVVRRITQFKRMPLSFRFLK